ncbi:hypothetical protein JHN59_37020 [Streptomyces sp. MBT49]|uniref:hypothetical protein n=1 Tax=unclassified Streptomyces TaxID=2593676 RepID=UPI00190B4645|nr:MULTISPECIES: hypothetical protein [unclassified Streptomyces]MBK3630303.1 hypothetical protein [Streptomyces sp. MBT49]MBK3634690.1 hypothetical protein [Streptomyces sp. MBT97]
MSDETEDEPETNRAQLPEDRLDEIRALVQTLGGRPDPGAVRGLLADARTALADLLADRDDLVRANGEAGAELACWRGDL